jgi:alanine dehydrogenase
VDPGFAEGVNVVAGKVTNKAVAESFGLAYSPLESFDRTQSA